MAVFVKSVLIDAPVDEVFRFHEREDALDLLSPGFPPVRKISATGGIKVGTRVELRVGLFRWVALHTAYEKDRLFVDEQIEGPFKKWVHRHEFERAGSGTRLTDRVEYELTGGALVKSLFGGAVAVGLRRMFAHRHRVTCEICERS
uniref:Cyclase/dehydrase n=1 Tax=Solibacter usitatus (strain Ellin6076) TaxID=234267 RepID=Q02AN6_SOLUE